MQICQWGAICAETGGTAICECPTCPAEFQPVCGDDGISYGNECKLRLEGCKHRREIRVLYQGLCSEYQSPANGGISLILWNLHSRFVGIHLSSLSGYNLLFIFARVFRRRLIDRFTRPTNSEQRKSFISFTIDN